VLSTRQEQLALAEQGLSRLERLRRSAAFSQARFEDQQRAVAIARAELRSARAAIGRADADYELARIEAERAQVTAPYPGVVVRRIVEAGAYAQSGDPLVRLVSDADLEVEADVPARRLAGLAPGATVRLELADGSAHDARVRAILPEENPQTRTRRVRFVPDFREPDGRRASGQSVTVQVPVGVQRQVLSVHKDAVIRQDDGAVVYVFADGKAEVRTVRLGLEIGPRFEVLDGLAPGALAVVRGNERLRPGQSLTIAERRGPSGANGGGGGSGSGGDS
jgi:RND family efflux transporter MFP subunit